VNPPAQITLRFDRGKLAALSDEQASLAGVPDVDAVHRLFCRTIRAHYDTTDVAFDDPRNQLTNDGLVAELNRPAWGRRRPLSGRELGAYRAGIIDKLYGRPGGRKCRVKRSDIERLLIAPAADVCMLEQARVAAQLAAWQPTVVCRVDADAHEGQTDAEGCVRDISDAFFEGNLYVEPTSRGWSGHAILDLPKIEWHGEGSGPYGCGWYVPSRQRVNEQLAKAEMAIVAHARHRGFTVTVELQGDETILTRDGDGRVTAVRHRGTLGRLPRCPHDADVRRLVAARFPFTILEDVTRAVDAQPVPAALMAKRPGSGPRSDRHEPMEALSVGHVSSLVDAGDKHVNSLRCCRLALRSRAGGPRTPGDLERLAEHAMDAYEGSGFHSGPRDRTRAKRFQRLMRYVIENPGSSAAAVDGEAKPYAREEDFEAMERLVRSRVSRAALARRYGRSDALRRQRSFDYNALVRLIAYVAVAYAKNERTGKAHEVPSSAIVGWLRHFGFRSVNGTPVKFATELLRDLGWLTLLAGHGYGQCAKWTVAHRLARKLPFLRDLVSLDDVATKGESDRDDARATNPEGDHLPYIGRSITEARAHVRTPTSCLSGIEGTFQPPVLRNSSLFVHRSPHGPRQHCAVA
jgi:hypothetical protein